MDDNIKNMEDIENKPSGQNPENSVEEFNNESTERKQKRKIQNLNLILRKENH